MHLVGIENYERKTKKLWLISLQLHNLSTPAQGVTERNSDQFSTFKAEGVYV